MTDIQTFEFELSRYLDLQFSQSNQSKSFYCKELLHNLTKIDGEPLDGYGLAVRLCTNSIRHDAVSRLREMSDFLVDYGNSLDVAATLNRRYLNNPARLLFLSKIHLACKVLLSIPLLYEISVGNLKAIRIDQIEFLEDDLNIIGLQKRDKSNRAQVIVARKCILDWVTVRKLDECNYYLLPHFERGFDLNPYAIYKHEIEKLTNYMLICRSGQLERLLRLNHEESSRVVSA